MEPSTKSSSAGHRKVIFESNCGKWAICLSLKRNELYYYNIITKESFWQKPDSLILTELEQETIKSYEQENGTTGSDHEPMDVSDEFEHLKVYNQSKESGDTCQNHKSSFKNNFDKCEHFESVSEKAYRSAKHSREAKAGKPILETSSIHISLNKFKTVPLTYKSPLNFNKHPESLEKKNVKIDGKQMQLKSPSINNLENSQTNSRKLFEHRSNTNEISNHTDDKTSFRLDSSSILPTQSVVLKNRFSSEYSVPQFLNTQSPFQVPSNGGVRIQKEPSDSVSRISKKLNDNCVDSDKTGDLQQLLQPINKKNILFQNDFKIQTEKFWSKQKKYDKKQVYPKTTSVSSQNSNDGKPQTKKKRAKKRQYRRMGYWLNKKAANELQIASHFNTKMIQNSFEFTKNEGEINEESEWLMCGIELGIARPSSSVMSQNPKRGGHNLPGESSQNNLSSSTNDINDEIMDCDDSAISFETASEISQLRAKELGSEQEFNTLEYSFHSPAIKPCLLLVFDTHTLINNHRFIFHLINAPPSEFPAAFVVPYVVLSELDRLKNNNLRPAYLQHVRRVIDLLQHSLLERHPRVIGQSAEDSKKQMDKDLNLSTIDNSVINCCLQYQKQGLDVVLFTNYNKLLIMANKYNILSSTKGGIVKEITVISLMKKNGYLDEQPINIDDDDNNSNKIPDNIVNMINNHLETPLEEYFGTVLKKAMFNFYGKDLWQRRFFVKPPWKFRDLCLNLRAHWNVLTNGFIDEETIRHNNNISRLLSNFSRVKWTENLTGELLDSIRHMTNHLRKYFPTETMNFLEHFKKCEIIYKTEMNKHKLLLRKPSEALSQAQDIKDIDYVFDYILSKLRNKCNEMRVSLNWGKIHIDKQMLPALHEVLKDVLLYHSSTENILKGFEGMSNHRSFLLTLTEPFVACFILGLQSIILLDITSDPQSSEQRTNLSGLITPQSVIDFFWNRKHSGSLFNTLSEVKTIHDGLIEIVNFLKQQVL